MFWYQKLFLIFKDRQLRNKVLFVLFIFVVFRLAANIPIPGIDTENLQRFFSQSQIFGLLNLFSGGALSRLSIVMLGLGPYITATIILQLLTMIFPAFKSCIKKREKRDAGNLISMPGWQPFPWALFKVMPCWLCFKVRG